MSSTQPRLWPSVLLAAVWAPLLVGCESPYARTTGTAAPPTPAQPTALVPSLPPITDEPRTDAAPTPVDRPSTAPPLGPQAQFRARLSAGVALPQSLPTGTAMGMSVDYLLLHAEPPPGGETVWVIESTQGAKVDIPVRLSAEGNLMEFVPGLKPEDGPFRSYLAVQFSDGRRVPFSDTIDMASP